MRAAILNGRGEEVRTRMEFGEALFDLLVLSPALVKRGIGFRGEGTMGLGS